LAYLRQPPNGWALPADGRAAERRPIEKMLRRRKRLGIAPREAPQRRVRALLACF